ncbi:MAG: hypothetical protein ACN6OP_29735, partial [Pseudomonadales bacterium]
MHMTPIPRSNDFYTRFKPIRNQLRRYSPLSVLRGCLDYLYAATDDPIGHIRKQPWINFLLVKWAFLDEDAHKVGRPAIPSDKLIQLLQEVYDLSDLTRMPSDYEHLTLFMRAIAYQQFLYQLPRTIDGLARQELLFAQTPDNHFFQTCFKTAHGLSIGDFLRLAICLTAHTQSKSGYIISRHWFRNLEPRFSPVQIDAFLAAISVPVEQLPEKLRESEDDVRQALELFQQTPFLRHPLIRVGDHYWCTHPDLTQKCLDHFIFDFLKKSDLQRFNEAFGIRFEKYVEKHLTDAGLSLTTEHQLKQALPGTGKVVDFLVHDEDANVFIDAKGVEMAPRGKVAHLRQVVRGATNSSLMKAFEQGQETCSRITEINPSNSIIQPRNKNYLLAVTYKELYIGNGLSLEACVGDNHLERIRQKFSKEKTIPLENIYFLSIDEFEGLMALVKARRIGLVEALELAKKIDSDPKTRK